MLNEKALKQAEIALVKAGDSISAKTRAALEAYLAARPDEDGLIREMRRAARWLRKVNVTTEGISQLERGADALEVARAAAPEISDDR